MKLSLLILSTLLSVAGYSQSVKISDMPAATTLVGTEIAPIVQSGTNKKATIGLIRGWSSIGTDGQLLRVNTGATGLEYFTPSYLSSYPGAGIPLSTGSAWGTSITNNSATWNKAITVATGTQELEGNKIINGSTSNFNLTLGDYSTNKEFGTFEAAANSILTLRNTGNYGSLLQLANSPTQSYFGYGPFHFNPFSDGTVGTATGGVRMYTNGYAGQFIIGIEPALNSGNPYVKLDLTPSSDATGDTYYRNSSGYFTRLAAGTNGHVLTLAAGIPSWAAPSGGGLTVGTSTITSGTNTKVLYNNSGVLGEYTVSGTGNVALTTSPTFTTPDIGTATGTASGDWHLTGTSTLTGASTIVGTSSNTNTFQYASLATSTTPVFTLENPTAAAAGAQQFSPFFRQRARGWKTNATAASQTVDFDFGVTPVQGAAAPTGYWSLWSSINGGSQSENVRFRSDGSIFLTGGTGFSANLYFGTSGDTYIGRGVSGTQGISVYGALTTANIYTLNMSPSLSYSYTSGTGGMLALAGNFTAASGAGNFYGSNSTGTINMTGTSSGNVFGYGVNQTVTAAKGDYTGFYHNPTITSVTGVHYSFRAASGKVLFGGTSITSNTFYDFRGGSSTDNILRLADGSNNELFTFKANKEYEVTQTNAKYQERHSTGTTAATTFSEVIYSSTDISDGQSVTIEVLWAAKDSGANTGAGGIFYTTWTKASGTLAKAGDNQSVTNDNMTGSWAISTSDSSGSIQLDFVGTGVANSEISFSTRIIKTN